MKTVQQPLSNVLKDSGPRLSQIQSMMAQAIMRPLVGKDRIQETWIDGSRTDDFASQFIKPNKNLNSLERLEIYNQQYWLRLIYCLEEDFPGVQVLLGNKKFRAFAFAYLQIYPSTSFSLNQLGHKLPDFLLDEPYWGEPNQDLLVDIARFEWAQVFALDAEQRIPLTAPTLSSANPMQLILKLQPHLVLLALNYPADTFIDRLELPHNKLSEASIGKKRSNKPLPKPTIPKRKKLYIAVFRDDNTIYSKRLEPAAFALLQLIKDSIPLGEACSIALADQLNSKNGSKIESQIATWFQTWVELKWFCF